MPAVIAILDAVRRELRRELVTVPEAGGITGVGADKVRRAINRGDLRAFDLSEGAGIRPPQFGDRILERGLALRHRVEAIPQHRIVVARGGRGQALRIGVDVAGAPMPLVLREQPKERSRIGPRGRSDPDGPSHWSGGTSRP